MRHVVGSRFAFLWVVVLLSVGAGPAALAAPKLQQLAVPADDGLTLALWAREVARPKGVIVLLHGRTWSALPDFDLQVPGDQRSVMQSLNARGYSAFALDMRGYGKTPRDATGLAHSGSRGARRGCCRSSGLRSRRRSRRPVLLGWSYGSLVAQLAAQRRPELMSARDSVRLSARSGEAGISG